MSRLFHQVETIVSSGDTFVSDIETKVSCKGNIYGVMESIYGERDRFYVLWHIICI